MADKRPATSSGRAADERKAGASQRARAPGVRATPGRRACAHGARAGQRARRPQGARAWRAGNPRAQGRSVHARARPQNATGRCEGDARIRGAQRFVGPIQTGRASPTLLVKCIALLQWPTDLLISEVLKCARATGERASITGWAAATLYGARRPMPAMPQALHCHALVCAPGIYTPPAPSGAEGVE